MKNSTKILLQSTFEILCYKERSQDKLYLNIDCRTETKKYRQEAVVLPTTEKLWKVGCITILWCSLEEWSTRQRCTIHNIFIFCEFGLITPVHENHAPKFGQFWTRWPWPFDPKLSGFLRQTNQQADSSTKNHTHATAIDVIVNSGDCNQKWKKHRWSQHYCPRESFRDLITGVGLSVVSVCLSVYYLNNKIKRGWIWTKFFGKVPRGKSKPKFVFGYDR